MRPVPLDHITRVQDLRDKDIVDAVVTREGTTVLLSRLAVVSAPETGVAKVLLVLARMATMACGWIDGDLVINLVDEGARTRVDVTTEMGGGMRERVLAPLRLTAPMAEFRRAIERVPHMIKPLAIRARDERRLTFSASAHVRRTTAPPPPVEIAAESLFVAPSPPVPKDTGGPELPLVTSATPDPTGEADVDEGWDT